MAGLKNGITDLWIRPIAIFAVFALIAGAGTILMAQGQKPWVAPDDAKKTKNPVQPTPGNLAAAAELFRNNCALCHGDKGKGDGSASRTSKVPLVSFTDAKLMGGETDGSLFWKISEGRGIMPAWSETLSEKERWQLVDYVRKLSKDTAKP